MTTATKTARMTLTLPEELHRFIKARAKQEGKTMRHYVLERLLPEAEDRDYDISDINLEIAQAFHEFEQYDKGVLKLPSIEDVIPSLK